jgi:Eco57I restriction-modification methylase
VPVEAKPIFRPDVIRLPLLGFSLPESVIQRRPKLEKWAQIIASGSVDAHTEQEILGDFLNDVFCELLGYTRAVDNPRRYTLIREKHVQANGKYADAVLGEFGPGGKRYVAAVEGKGPKDPLDRPFAGRRVSAVDQAFDYAINLRCPWILVTNIRQTRLYSKGADKQTYERFDTEHLAADERQLRKFVFLLHANRMVPAHGSCHLDTLFQESEKVGRELTKEVYAEYAFIRRSTLSRLRWANPGVAPRLILGCAQKLLDRILFIAFCEDRGLLPAETIQRAYAHRDPYNPRPLWDNFRGMFRAIDTGSDELDIRKYNGGLFADDPVLDNLKVPDEVFGLFRDLAEYDFRPASAIAEEEAVSESSLVDVEILGHIFEQSIDDLEKLQAELDRPAEPPPALEAEASPEKEKVSRRKREGAFYTPAYITRYIVEQALGGVLRDRFETLRRAHVGKAKGTVRSVMADPAAYDLDSLNAPQREALLAFWLDWQLELASIRILDPACGSGAFLIEAFDQLHAEYQHTRDRVQELRGFAELFDLDRKILQENLYGVDLNDEAVRIAQLSLWIKTAVKGKELTSLDHTLRVGNSIVADPTIDPRAFDWQAQFPEVFRPEPGVGGFDVVIGNPPYIRQEWLSPIKPYLQSRYAAYHGMADLYVYFYELGLSLLKPGGRLSYVVTNKWMKAGYGEPLRKLFADRAWVESVVDFGHAKQIFQDADVFPSIIVVRRPDDAAGGLVPETTRVCAIPREQLRIDDLSVQIAKEGAEVDRRRLSAGAWSLEPEAVNRLLDKIRSRGVPLTEYAGVKPLMGIKTGLNDAFLIDTATRTLIVQSDPGAQDIIRPYLRGQDIGRWSPAWAGLWMIALKSSGDHPWPWANAGDEAEALFRESYRGLHAHLKPFEDALRKRQDQGRYWWELRACAYWREFQKPKLIYQEIQFHPWYAFDGTGSLANNKTFFLASGDLYLLGLLNCPLMWWHNHRYLPHMKDEALTPVAFLVEKLPIAMPSEITRQEVEQSVRRLIEITASRRLTTRDLLDWLRVEHSIAEPGLKLQSALELDSESLATEVRKARGKKNPLSLAALRSLREEHTRTILPAQDLAREALGLERRISDLVNEAYGLTPEEVGLMWETAPPRMPIPRP